MALSEDVIRTTRGTPQKEVLPIATGQQIYIGSAVCQRTTTGRAVAGHGTARRTAGVAVAFHGPDGLGMGNGLGVADGSQQVEVAYGDEVEFPVRTAYRTNTHIGLNVFWSDDDAVMGTAIGTAGVRVVAGELVAFSNAAKSRAFVAVRRFASVTIAS